jgi:nucleoid-associated protein YgaU
MGEMNRQNFCVFLILAAMTGCIQHQQVSLYDLDEELNMLKRDESTLFANELFLEEELLVDPIEPQPRELTLLFTQSEEEWLEELMLADDISFVDSSTRSAGQGSSNRYTVRRGDTLMMIAFNQYGDYNKWREISQWNNGIKTLAPGQELVLKEAPRPYRRPAGRPYLIKPGDTLGRISHKVYGSSQEWQTLWSYNKAQIRNPNLIFAGFTLFYEPANPSESAINVSPF